MPQDTSAQSLSVIALFRPRTLQVACRYCFLTVFDTVPVQNTFTSNSLTRKQVHVIVQNFFDFIENGSIGVRIFWQ